MPSASHRRTPDHCQHADTPGGEPAPHGISRRQVLASALAAGLMPSAALAGVPPLLRLLADTRVLEINGRSARVLGLLDPDGCSGVRFAPGERFRVELLHRTGARTIVHWHGQLPPWTQDGFPWPQTPPLRNGATHAYDYAPIAGTYWMHSHHRMQEQQLLTAPLIVQDAATLQQDRQEIVLMLLDFTFRTPDAVLACPTGTTPSAARDALEVQIAAGRNRAHPAMPAPAHAAQPRRMDLYDVTYEAFLANDRTLADPEIVRVERGGRVRLRIVNGASASQYGSDLGALNGHVVATDGHAVNPAAGCQFPGQSLE